MKGKEEASERMLTEKEASQLSDTEFKAMVIRKLTELSELKDCLLYTSDAADEVY